MASIFDKSQIKDFRGAQPSADYVSRYVRNYIHGEMTESYTDLLNSELPNDIVDNTRDFMEDAEFVVGQPSENPFFVTDEDMGISGSTGRACAIVKPGHPKGHLRIIFAHTDSPCLRVRPQPVYVDTDAISSNACPSISLMTEPYGGIRPDDWYGMDVDIVGETFLRGRRKRVKIPGLIKHNSLHIDDGRERTADGLLVDTGFRTLKELYKSLGIRNGMDFGRMRLYAIPHFEKNAHIVGNEIGSYGADDISCLWAAREAALNASTKRHRNTMLTFFLDREEVGSQGGSGGYRGFFEAVLKETLRLVYGDSSDFDLPLDLNRNLLGGMPAISADVDVGMTQQELWSNGSEVDVYNIAKPGWGFYICAGGPDWERRDVSPKHVDMLMQIMDKHLDTRSRERYQITGKPLTPDSGIATATMADVFDSFMPCIEMGIPVTGLHNPRAETLNLYDLYWLSRGYEVYLRK